MTREEKHEKVEFTVKCEMKKRRKIQRCYSII